LGRIGPPRPEHNRSQANVVKTTGCGLLWRYRYQLRYQGGKTADAIARNDKGLSKKAFVFNTLH